KRDTLLQDGANPVYDKEIRSEIFSQGTLMLRVVIQISIFLAILPMAFWLYIWPQYTPWYVSYVVIFNMLVGPVFSAGSVTSERERQTLDLLLTTVLTPWQILSGKLRAGLRVSSVLTLFLLWPLLLACVMVSSYWTNLGSVAAYTLIVLLTCLTTAVLALFCSVVFRKTSTSLMTTYLVIILLFCAPLATNFLAHTFYGGPSDSQGLLVDRCLQAAAVTSPFVAAFSVPLEIDRRREEIPNWRDFAAYVLFTLLANALLMVLMIRLFNMRWRVAD
ncbi:MAG: ABC transporter permease subunit, partial [Pirellulaceae bacterium]